MHCLHVLFYLTHALFFLTPPSPPFYCVLSNYTCNVSTHDERVPLTASAIRHQEEAFGVKRTCKERRLAPDRAMGLSSAILWERHDLGLRIG